LREFLSSLSLHYDKFLGEKCFVRFVFFVAFKKYTKRFVRTSAKFVICNRGLEEWHVYQVLNVDVVNYG